MAADRPEQSDPPTAHEDAAEPAGEQDAANEAERIPPPAGSEAQDGGDQAEDEPTKLRRERDELATYVGVRPEEMPRINRSVVTGFGPDPRDPSQAAETSFARPPR